MTNSTKISNHHLCRLAMVYIRQSTPNQLKINTESTKRQYALVSRLSHLGWHKDNIHVIDDDLGISGSSAGQRNGFKRLISEVAKGNVGIVIGLEASRLARNNADWYRLIEWCQMTDTLIADSDGIYDSRDFNDRLVLGLKGTMSEAKLHIMRARLQGGIRNKAMRGEMHRGLAIGFELDKGCNEILIDSNEAVSNAIHLVFKRFADMSSARQVWIWFHKNKIELPSRRSSNQETRWRLPTYSAVHHILVNPIYAGIYAYGRTRNECFVDEQGVVCKRTRHLPINEWQVFIPNHHESYIDLHTWEVNRTRLLGNRQKMRSKRKNKGPAREGAALLQGLVACGNCGRQLYTRHAGRGNSTYLYHCTHTDVTNGQGTFCMRIRNTYIDKAIATLVRQIITPAATDAIFLATEQLESDKNTVLKQARLDIERKEYAASRAERRYRAVDPENRLVARGLEKDWENELNELEQAKSDLVIKIETQQRQTDKIDHRKLHAIGSDLRRVWDAPTTTNRDRKSLVRTIIEDVTVSLNRDTRQVHLVVRWRGGLINELDIELPARKPNARCTNEDIIQLVRRLAEFYGDSKIAAILSYQGRKTAFGHTFSRAAVYGLRERHDIPAHTPSDDPLAGKLHNIGEAAKELQVAPSTLHRWLNEGIIPGEQITPGAPWQIRITAELKNRFVDKPPQGYLTMHAAMASLGVSRQTVVQRIMRGDLDSIHIRRGRKKGLYIRLKDEPLPLFEKI